MRIYIVALGLFLALVSSVCFCQQQVGTAYFSNEINWSQTPDLHFTILGGQANVCGELVTFRNGSWLYVPGWACTNANGDANMGPWTWASTSGDQTDINVQIIWPNGNYTNATSDHIWDKTCPDISISTAYPGSFTGTGTDNQWGAGFDDGWTKIKFHYLDITGPGPAISWDGTSYNPSAPQVAFDGTLSTMPSHSVNWSATSPPPANAHISGHTYQWVIDFYDNDDQCSIIVKYATFTY